uniref:Homeobox domain-containing protein n=3 Tax=Aegilops tauschii TaxID=37682 RepID=A0A453DMU8_AEGTS
VYTNRHQHKGLQEAIHHYLIAYIPFKLASRTKEEIYLASMFMAQEEPGLALGLSLGSGAGHHHHHLPQPKEAVPLEPYLSLSLAGAGAVKREEEERALIYCSDDLVEGYNSSGGGGSRKKLRLTKDQTALLEDHFKEQSTLSHASV